MPRYYTCLQCDNLVKENSNCNICNPTLKAVGIEVSETPITALKWCWPDPDDANYTAPDDDGTSD